MEDVNNLLKSSMTEIEKMLNSKTVVGEAITVGDATMIPLVSIGFGFGAGGGSGKGTIPTGELKGDGEGIGMGTGGGGGIKPVAMIIVDKKGVRIETIKGGASSAFESVGTAIGKAIGSDSKKKGEE